MADISSLSGDLVDLILSSYFRNSGPDRTIEHVSITRPSDSFHFDAFQDTAFVSLGAIREAAFMLRDKGPPHFRSEPIFASIEALRSFFRDHHYIIFDEVINCYGSGPYADFISDKNKKHLSEKLLSSEVLNPTDRLFLFPLTPVDVKAAFSGANFSLVDPRSACGELPERYRHSAILNGRMPSFDQRDSGEPVKSWLIIHGPSSKSVNRSKIIVLGALALAPIYRERYIFTFRKIVCNYIFLHDGVFTRSSNPHTPPLSDGLTIRSIDHSWLAKVDLILKSEDKQSRGKRNALDYFYRAWFMEPSERCSLMFVCLDALYEHTGLQPATKRMKEGIEKSLRDTSLSSQLRFMMELRNSILHGGCSDIFESSKYHRYWENFGTDIFVDLEIVAAKCLRREVFGDDFVPQADPHADLLAKHQKLGHIATDDWQHVVEEWP